MPTTPGPSPQPNDLDEILALILRQIEAGLPLDVAAWCDRYPSWAEEIRSFCADLARFAPLLCLEAVESSEATRPFASQGTQQPAAADGLPRLGGYELLAELGRGGMGVVYRARPAGTESEVALKVFDPDQLGGTDGLSQLRAEFNSVCKLKHPNVVPVYHYGEEEGRSFYTMELIDSPAGPRSLADEMASLHREPRRAVELLEKVARAVHHAHQRQILHRDLKPANVLIDAAGEPRVTDFGLAVRLAGGRTAAGLPAAGSLPWMAPETLQNDRELTTAIDVWALGVILYELMTGRRPFTGNAAQTCEQIIAVEPAPPRAEGRPPDADLEAICLCCLRKDPARRYGSAEALAEDLARWRQGKIPHARERVGKAERLLRWCRANPLAVSAPLLAILFLAGVAAAALDALRAQERRTVEEVTQGNRVLAGHAASTTLTQLQTMADALIETANDPRFHDRIEQDDPEAFRTYLEKTRQEQNAKLRHKLGTPGEEPLSTMILLDPSGKYVAETPRHPKAAAQIWVGRDYFHKALERDKATGRARVHVSRIFRSEIDGLFKLALSMPIHSRRDPTKLVGVLMTTIATGPTLGRSPGSDTKRRVILVGPQDGYERHRPPAEQTEPELSYLILLHPGYNVRERNPRTLDAARLPELRARGTDDELDLPPADLRLRTDEDYRDPMAERDAEEYGGRWLAAFCQVGNTELVVGVQQKYDEAVAPSRVLQDRLLRWACVGGGAIAVTLGAIWAVRRWRGRKGQR